MNDEIKTAFEADRRSIFVGRRDLSRSFFKTSFLQRFL